MLAPVELKGIGREAVRHNWSDDLIPSFEGDAVSQRRFKECLTVAWLC